MPLNILQRICSDENIDLSAFPGFERLNGISLRTHDDLRGIAYSPTLDGYGQTAVIAHELGHHVLGHLDRYSKHTPERKEREAQTFAAVFIAMALVAQYLLK